MITSDKYKIHWWGIGANGSATMFWTLTNLFNMPSKKGAGGRRNNYDNNSFKKGYKKIVNTRNPYEWITAVLFDHNQLDNFDVYLKNNLMNLELMRQVKEWEKDGFTPDYFINCDDMYGSLLKIPELKAKAEELGDELFFTVNTPDYDTLGKGRQRLVKGGWKQYWNQELVDNVLANKYLKRLFDLTGYDEESWK
tara:strand:+ start:1327 stop:1911 length:585 start_codon:yes stop_codon:yes gene_type:complete